jgi:hypothetical protein
LYEALYALYNNDDAIVPDDTTRRLRTVVNRSVEFYAAKMIPGQEFKVITGEDETENSELQDAISRLSRIATLQTTKPP